ncbi:hypothetical protein [Haloplanus aerogenes]|uniref:Cohesin domain-containing protein n=1 Tax=Haloplanus aerogenes TaxID=660522 RepID=A0A3M0DSK4_9EURY|nr:hypothetical protein [Haloplanus aerogenes]AZH25271.1 hypothetical protein DU502_07705 [Haloplanus aerogenes]RMB24962.1 hypothetical protein ATH50_0042 [Haloplanus aerogenes]
MNGHTVRDLLTVHGRRLAAVVLVTLVVAVATVGAAGATTVRLSSADDVSVSETTTVDVVVNDADSGVGAYNVTVALTNPSIASITDVELLGNPSDRTSRVERAADGSSVTMVAALMDTADTGTVTIARVTLRADGTGSTGLDLTVAALGDERGDSYTVGTETTSLTVLGDGNGESGSIGTDQSDEAASMDSSSDGPAVENQVRNTRLDELTQDPRYLVGIIALALIALLLLRRLT